LAAVDRAATAADLSEARPQSTPQPPVIVIMPNGSECELERLGCPDCEFRTVTTPRRAVLILWRCAGGCGYEPDLPIGGAS
jgi:hypothetical protein